MEDLLKSLDGTMQTLPTVMEGDTLNAYLDDEQSVIFNAPMLILGIFEGIRERS